MKNLLLTLSLSLAAMPVLADALTPTAPGTGSTDLPPARTPAPAPAAAPAPAPAPVAAPAPAPQPVAAPAPAPTPMPVAAPASLWYGNINAGGGWANLDSGGLNTAGPHANTGDDEDSGFGFLGLSIGRSIGNNLRIEAEFTGRNSSDFTTNSFQPPTPTFFYDSSAKTYSGIMNLLYDHPINSQWSAFIGAGLGVAFVDLKTNDTVVEGSGNEANFAWQAMLGAAYAIDKANSVNFGYRYFDAGNTDIALRDIGTGGAAGSFKADIVYHDILSA